MIGGHGSVPWRDSDLVALAGSGLVGLIAILAGWFGASGSSQSAHQSMWLIIAVAGFVVFALANCLWFMRLRRSVGERRVALVSFEAAEQEVVPEHIGAAARISGRPTFAPGQWVRGEGMAHVHRSDCPIVEGKQVEPANAADGERCGVCADG